MPKRKEKALPRVYINGILQDRLRTLELIGETHLNETEDLPSSTSEAPSEPSFEVHGEPLTTHEVLLNSLNRHIRLAWISLDLREANYIQPVCDAAGRVIAGKYSFVGFRFVKYRGEEFS